MKKLSTILFGGVCLILFALLVLAGPVGTAQADDVAVVNNWVAAWNAHDADAVAALFTADAVYEDIPFGIVNHGRGEIHEFAEFFFTVAPDLHVQLLNSSLKGGHGTIEWIFSGTDVGIYHTGKHFSVRGVTVIDVNGTQISRNVDYYDLATMLRQFGLLPAGL